MEDELTAATSSPIERRRRATNRTQAQHRSIIRFMLLVNCSCDGRVLYGREKPQTGCGGGSGAQGTTALFLRPPPCLSHSYCRSLNGCLRAIGSHQLQMRVQQSRRVLTRIFWLQVPILWMPASETAPTVSNRNFILPTSASNAFNTVHRNTMNFNPFLTTTEIEPRRSWSSFSFDLAIRAPLWSE